MNRKILFWGLTPIQFTIISLFGVIIVLGMVICRVGFIVLILFVVIFIFLFILIFKKVKRQNEKGNPDFIQGYLIKSLTPKKIVDKKCN